LILWAHSKSINEGATKSRSTFKDVFAFHFPTGKAHLSRMMDCFDGMVVSWSIGLSLDADLVNAMLKPAIETVGNNAYNAIAHSDRDGHYRWPDGISRVDNACMIRSPDKAVCE
jgi:putative transposase